MRQLLLVGLFALSACGGSSPVAPSPPAPPPPPPPPLFTLSGSGNTVFDMPTHVTRIQIRGVWSGIGFSTFVVRIGGRLIVAEVLRDMPNRTYEGIHLTMGGVTEITDSSSIAWTFTEVR